MGVVRAGERAGGRGRERGGVTVGAPRVSVVIPTYNAAAFLAEAVASARAQTYAPVEVVVVDDASADGTADLAESLGARAVRQEENRGPSAARNRGVAVATGDVVAFLDADDAWLPWHLELCVAALGAHPRAAVACTEPIPWSAEPPSRPAAPRSEVPGDATLALLGESFVEQAGAVVRRTAVAEAGGYDESRRYAEDFDLWLRIAARHQFVRVRAPGLRRRPHPGQASHATLRMFESAYALRLRTLDVVAAQGDRARDAAAAAVLRSLESDFRTAWYLRDDAAFDHLLDVAARLPAGGAAARSRWALRRRVGWHAWHALRRLKRSVVGAAP
jgi:glycosyltransferase involved in cell wall biosynthesis